MAEAPGGAENENLNVFMLAPEPYVVTDSRGAIIDLNLAAQRFFSAGPQGLIHKPLQVFITPRELPAFRSRLNTMIPGDVYASDHTVRTYDGSEKRISLSGVKNIQGHGEQRIYWLFRDVTEREHAAQQIRDLNDRLEARVNERTAALDRSLAELQKANGAKDDFLSMVSHELRTPLTVAVGNARFLAAHRQALSDEDIASSLADIVKAGDKLQQLIDNLMVLARVDAQHADLSEPIALQHTVPRIVEELRGLWTDHPIQVDLPSDLPTCKAVPIYVEQIVANLISNGAKYGTPGTPIHVTGRAGRRTVLISIANEGKGIPREERGAIFQPFFRSAATRKTQSGMGIGLTVVKRLVHAQGGRIWVGPTETGAAFCFNLPIWPELIN